MRQKITLTNGTNVQVRLRTRELRRRRLSIPTGEDYKHWLRKHYRREKARNAPKLRPAVLQKEGRATTVGYLTELLAQL